jgi:hypothetical protein
MQGEVAMISSSSKVAQVRVNSRGYPTLLSWCLRRTGTEPAVVPLARRYRWINLNRLTSSKTRVSSLQKRCHHGLGTTRMLRIHLRLGMTTMSKRLFCSTKANLGLLKTFSQRSIHSLRHWYEKGRMSLNEKPL